MTAATLHLGTPTRVERTLLRVADGLTALVVRRREIRAARREIAIDILREQQLRKRNPHDLDIALLTLGSRPRH